MMKKWMTLVLAALMLTGLLSGCGSDKAEDSAQESDVALDSFYAGLAEDYHWSEDPEQSEEGDLLMSPIEGEMLESYYPGLSDLATKQFVAKMPLMSSVVNEIVLVQCETEEDAKAAAAILQDRVDAQAEGGAWYPESMEAWGKASVIQQGTYVAMIASAEHQSDIEEAFNAQFA